MYSDPNPALIDWVNHYKLVEFPYDRPWYNGDHHCKKTIKLKAYTCEDQSGEVSIGQCPNCKAILWKYEKFKIQGSI
jgi:hypothetical protein